MSFEAILITAAVTLGAVYQVGTTASRWLICVATFAGFPPRCWGLSQRPGWLVGRHLPHAAMNKDLHHV
jgi:hypothetical protein